MSDLVPWMAPYSGWLILLALGVLGLAIATFALFADRAKHRRCPRCGYDLSHTPGDVCSECGRRLRSEADGYRTKRHWRWAIVGLIVAVVLPAFVVQRRVQVFGWDYYTYVGPLYWLLPDETIAEADDGRGLRVCVQQDRRRLFGGGRYNDEVAIATIDGREVWRTHDWYVSLRGETDSSPPARDVDHDGSPEIIIETSGGGNGGYAETFVLHRDGSRVIDLNPNHGGGMYASFDDLDRDGRLEMLTTDGCMSFFNACHAASTYPKVILALDATGRYAVSSKLMRATGGPNAQTVREAIAACRASGQPYANGSFDEPLSVPLVSTMTDLVYAGRGDEALAFCDAAWPGDAASKQSFLDEFRKRLGGSSYRDVLRELAGPAMWGNADVLAMSRERQ